MARLRVTESVETDRHSSIYRDPSMPPPQRRVRGDTSPPRGSPSQSPSFASDKENQTTSRVVKDGQPHLSAAVQDPTERANKRRRVSERDPPHHTSGREEDGPGKDSDANYYDPDQNIGERREIRKGLRDLTKELNDSRAEFLQADSTGLKDTIKRADKIFANVKQTSDATIDSRLLVSAGDLAHKKSNQLQLGDASQQIDVDEFVSKCISFMRRGDRQDHSSRDTTAPPNTQRRQTQRNIHDDGGDEDDEDEAENSGNGLNWEWFGARACIPNNSRPPVPGFLLGPLSVQKRVRAPRVRRERLQRNGEATRPEELKPADIDRQENNHLTIVCGNIRKRLKKVIRESAARVQDDFDAGFEAEAEAKMKKLGMCNDGGLNLFRFTVNPNSFGQTVENLFYVSFLIRDGMVAIGEDDEGTPSLHDIEQGSTQATGDRRKTNQAVFSLDFDTFRELIDVYDIIEPLIPDRKADESATQVASRGWYA